MVSEGLFNSTMILYTVSKQHRGSRVLTRILKIGVKCCCPEKVGVLPYFSIETFQKVGVRNEKLE